MKEIGQELFQAKNHRETLTGISISTTINKAASCGDNTIKIHELNDLKDTSNVISLDDERGLDHMDWSEDGQLLAVSTSKGNLHVYLCLSARAAGYHCFCCCRCCSWTVQQRSPCSVEF